VREIAYDHYVSTKDTTSLSNGGFKREKKKKERKKERTRKQ